MLKTGTVLQNRYRIASLLGQGGMGAVYRAWHLRLNLPVAVKEMTHQPGIDANTLAQLREQFEQEAAILARLEHPHLVDVIDFFEEGGNVYLVMDFVEGESLGDRIETSGALPEDEVLKWGSQLLDALAYCHSKGILHRDVKPQNVIIQPDGKVKLVDFGLVKLWDPKDPRTKTAMRGMGSPEYAPPEQYGAQGAYTGPRSDLYSVGATLYHALAGHPPLTAADRMADPDGFKPLRTINSGVSRQTEATIHRALEMQRRRRFHSARDMAGALTGEAARSVTQQVSQAQPSQPSPPPVPRPQPAAAAKRKPRSCVWIVAILAVPTIIGITIGIILAVTRKGPSPTPSVPVPSTAPSATPADTGSSPPILAATGEPPTPAPTATPTPPPTSTPPGARPTQPVGPGNSAQVAQLISWNLETVNHLAFPPDGQLMAIASAQEVYVYETTNFREIRSISAGAWVSRITFAPDGTLATLTDDYRIQLWRAASGALLETFEEATYGAICIAFSPDGQTLATGVEEGAIQLWQIPGGRSVRTLEGHSGSVYKLAFSPDGTNMASAAWDDTVRLWDPSGSGSPRILEGHTGNVNGVAFSLDGSLLASGGWDNLILIWRTPSGTLERTLEGHTGRINQLVFSPGGDGAVLATASMDESIRLWDVTTGRLLHTLEGNLGAVRSVSFSPDGLFLASGSKDGTVRLWGVPEN